MSYAKLILLTSLAAVVPALAQADDPMTLQLGAVQVKGDRQVIQTLHAIKLALHEPFSDSAADAGKVVCRIVKQLGETREYLDCATNRDYTQRRDATQLEALKHLGDPAGAEPLSQFMAVQPEHRIHTVVNGAALQAVLEHIPDVLPPEMQAAADGTAPKPVPAATTQKAPASATSQPSTQW